MSSEVIERPPTQFKSEPPIYLTDRNVLQGLPSMSNKDHWWEDQEALNAVREKLQLHVGAELDHCPTIVLPSGEIVQTAELKRTIAEKHFIIVDCITDRLNLHNNACIEPVRVYYTEYKHDEGIKECPDETENAVLFAHGWVCGQKDIVSETGGREHLNYHDKVMSQLNSNIHTYAVEPPGYATNQSDDLESVGPDQLDALNMHNYPRVIEAALEKIAMDMHARGKKGRIALVGHSMGGWASSQVSVEFVGDIKEKYGVDIVIELTAPAFQMHKITSVGRLTPALTPLLLRIRNTLDHLPIRRVTQVTSERITKGIVHYLGPLLSLKPEDIFMQQARRTDVRTMIRNLQDLWGNHYSIDEVRQITSKDFIKRIWLAKKDALVDNNNLLTDPKAIEVVNEGHLLERNNAFAQLLARHLEKDVFQLA